MGITASAPGFEYCASDVVTGRSPSSKLKTLAFLTFRTQSLLKIIAGPTKPGTAVSPARCRRGEPIGFRCGRQASDRALLAALLVPAAGWRCPYLVVGLLSVGLIVFFRALPVNPVRPAAAGGRIDYFGAAALIAGPSALLAGLVLGRTGWVQPTVLADIPESGWIDVQACNYEGSTELSCSNFVREYVAG
ncbi:hypothetical protein AB0F91_45645 [Amycolatopsis sp. NPDC023774]|uniref:hypothetical protein n=1 Tax=Amycolatopsis sp. NPDC023774 TaxID=3155015 RepID=UPI0033F7A078